MAVTQKPIILDETGRQIANSITSQGAKMEEIISKYSPFIGATSTANGNVGLVPAPTASDTVRFLSSKAEWVVPEKSSAINTKLTSVNTEHPLLLHSKASAGADVTVNDVYFVSGIRAIPSSKSLKVDGTITSDALSVKTGDIEAIDTNGITVTGNIIQTGNTNIVGSFSASGTADVGGKITSTSLSTGECSAAKVVSTGEVIAKTQARVAASNGIPDLIIRNDGSHAYLLFSDYANGSWNSLRPLTINIASGNITSSGTFTASKVYNAVWNDYAEFFPRGEETELGDFIALDLDSDEERYVKASHKTSKAVGLHSETFGHMIGGDNPPNGEDFIFYNLPKFIPVGLVGRCYAKIIGTIDKGDLIIISDVPGVGKRFDRINDNPLDVIGMACESSSEEEIKLVKIKVGN